MFSLKLCKFVIGIVFRNHVKSCLYVFFISICYTMLLLICSTTDTAIFVIDRNINSQIQYRQFSVILNYEGSQKESYMEYIKNIPGVVGLTVKTSSELPQDIVVTIDDYEKIGNILKELKRIDDCDIILDADYVVDLSLIRSIKTACILVLVLILSCTFGIVYAAIYNSVKEKTREIMLYKAVGYRNNNLYMIVICENIIYSLLSFLISILSANITLRFIINPIIAIRMHSIPAFGGIRISPAIYLLNVAIICIITWVTSLTMVARIKRLPIIGLLRE